MCLYNRPQSVKEILKKAKVKKRKFIWVYKWICADGTNICQGYGIYTYKAGINRSNSRATKPRMRHVDINRGIHTYRFNSSMMSDTQDRVQLKVKGYIKDLLGASGTQIVFKQITIPKSQMKKVKSCS